MTAEEDAFPPVSTSLDKFLVDGRDEAFREMIYALLAFSAQMLRSREFYAAHIGVTAPQYSILARIGEAGAITMRDLATSLNVSSPFVTAETGKLNRRGYLRRCRNVADGRSVLLSLSDSGKALIRKVAPMRRMANDIVFGSLDAEQARVLREVIPVLAGNLKVAIRKMEEPRWQTPAN